MDDLFTEADPVRVVRADSLVRLRRVPEAVFDAVVSDPPYGLEFMGKKWDGADGFRRSLNRNDSGRGNVFGRTSRKGPEYRAGSLFQEWCYAWGTELVRVLKPGGYAVVFGGTRTYHRLACALEDAGFEIRDCLMWLYGSGFPKHKACLKPAYEPILLCRKPGQRSEPLNVDECRIGTEVRVSVPTDLTPCHGNRLGSPDGWGKRKPIEAKEYTGRWPANVVHDGSDEVLAAFGGKTSRSSPTKRNRKPRTDTTQYRNGGARYNDTAEYGDAGSVARFFYCAKVSRKERHSGVTDPGKQFKHGVTLRQVENTATAGNTHPTVKPVALMRWLVRLVCPKGGLVLDPFAGSGTTGVACVKEGRRCLLIEKDRTYAEIARARVAKAVCVRRQRPDLGVA